MKIILTLIIISFSAFACNKSVNKESVVYQNDLENSDLQNISNGQITTFNNSKVLGRYNNGFFTIALNDVAEHDLIQISFDLLIHDSWDGNKPLPDGPDKWEMSVDGETYISTTFSNVPCLAGNFCPPQSFPLNYPNNNSNPRAGASRTDLPGACSGSTLPDGTSLYKIVKTITHSSKTLKLQCMDKLIQTDSQDPQCEESWSVDNIQIKVIKL